MINDFTYDTKRVLAVGVDEVGRGPLVGDVVAAAVILGQDHTIEGLTDSKKLSEKKREVLFDQIKEQCVDFAIARATPSEIDEINILHATMLAMKRAVDGLTQPFNYVYVDGNRLPKWPHASRAVIKGDLIVEEISAASILAKVTRDREMQELDSRYPGYGIAKHKGYPTKAHLEALARLGPTPEHRKSFKPVQALLQASSNISSLNSASE